MDKISKICLVSSIVISLGLICGITTYKIVSNHNEKVLLVESKAIIEQAKKCINDKKCQKDENITLKKLYEEEIVPNLTKKFNYTTKMQVPKIEKIVLNMGVGDAVNDQKFLDAAVRDLEAIAGQKPVITTAKKSIAGFKLRAGNKIGCKVTLRGDNMYNFLNKLITIALPRVRDFRGISKNSFDGRGNYTLGIKEQLVFPEVEYDQVIKVRGLDIVIVTTAKTNEEALALLTEFGLPFRK